jgi:hypothetical protein
MTTTTTTEGKTMYDTTFHRDHTVTVWDVYRQRWLRTSCPSDQTLASLPSDERQRVMQWCAIDENA